MPALHLARIDLLAGTISVDQQAKVRSAMVAVIAAIGGESHACSAVIGNRRFWRFQNAGRELRRQREQISGRWQGPLVVPAGSVMVCVGLGSCSDDLATELLVRILRDQKIDARHMSLEDMAAVPPPNAAEAVSIVYVVSAFPSERARAQRGDGGGNAPAVSAGVYRRRVPPRHAAATRDGNGERYAVPTGRHRLWAMPCRSASICIENRLALMGRTA